LTTRAGADDSLFRHCLADGDQSARAGDVTGALRIYLAAEQTSAGNVTNLCVLTKEYCNLMRESSARDLQKTLAETAFKCAQAALRADPQNATAHVCVAVTLAKMFPYVSNQTKVVYSRQIKTECERAIALDPRQDVAYYLLGRWNFGVANMNFLYKGLVRLIYGGLPPASNAEAVKDLQRAVALNPARIIHHRELGRIYAVLGQKDAARQQLELCARLKPLDPDDEEAQAEAVHELSTL
jgi:tetratricopeptide (TPR) repeat protein